VCQATINLTQPHDVVGANTWLKRWAEGRKGEDGMTVNQELDLDGRAENGRNLGRAIEIWGGLSHKPISFSQKSASRGLRILGVYI